MGFLLSFQRFSTKTFASEISAQLFFQHEPLLEKQEFGITGADLQPEDVKIIAR